MIAGSSFSQFDGAENVHARPLRRQANPHGFQAENSMDGSSLMEG